MKLRLGEMDFQSMGDAKKYVMNLAKGFVGREIHPGSEHFEFFSALWLRSPNWESGLTHFEIGRKFMSAAFVAVTHEGKRIDFSLRTAVRGKDVGTWTKLTIALRGSIRPQIQTFKAECDGLCEMCGATEHLEIDHVVSFKSLMRGYLDSKNDVYPGEYDYNHSGWRFKSADWLFERDWQEWHRQKCLLRPLCSGCHLVVTKIAAAQARAQMTTRFKVK